MNALRHLKKILSTTFLALLLAVLGQSMTLQTSYAWTQGYSPRSSGGFGEWQYGGCPSDGSFTASYTMNANGSTTINVVMNDRMKYYLEQNVYPDYNVTVNQVAWTFAFGTGNDGAIFGWKDMPPTTVAADGKTLSFQINETIPTTYFNYQANVYSPTERLLIMNQSYDEYDPGFSYSFTCPGGTQVLTLPDRTPPTYSGAPFYINNNAASVSNTSGLVSISGIFATDNVGLAHCDASNDGTSWTNVGCNTAFNWTLDISSGSGDKSVWGRACDTANNCNYMYYDYITYNDPDYVSAYCLAPSNGITLNSVTKRQDGQYEIKFSISSAMASKSAWKNSTYKVVANIDTDYNKYPWANAEENAERYATVTPTFNGTEGTIIVAAPPNVVGSWDIQRDWYDDQLVRYISIFPDKAVYTSNNTYLCDGFVKGMKIPVSKTMTITGRDGTVYSLLVEDSTSIETTVTATLLSPANTSVTLQGQTLTTGVPVTLSSIPAETVLNVRLPGENFDYNFVRPIYGQRNGSPEQTLSNNPAPVRTVDYTDFTFNRRRYQNLSNTRYMSNDFTHYRLAKTVQTGETTTQEFIGGWTALPAGNYINSSTQVQYRITNIPREATSIYFTVSPSEFYTITSTWGNNNRTRTEYLLDQINATVSYPLPPAPDIVQPTVTELTVAEDRAGFVRENTLTISPIVSDDVGVTQCLIGRSATTITNEVNCSGFSFDLFSALPAEDGPSTLYFIAKDAAGNSSDIFSKVLTLDRSKPTLPEFDALTTMEWSASPYSLSLTCADLGSGCANIWYSLATTQEANCGTPTEPVTGSISIAEPTQLCVRMRDSVGNEQTYGPLNVKVDGELPTFGTPSITSGETTILPQSSTYYLQASEGNISVNVSDNSKSGIRLDSCTVSIDGNNIGTSTCSIVDDTLTTSIPNALADGMHTIDITVADMVGNPNTLSLSVFVDTQNPTFTLGNGVNAIGVDVLEPNRALRVIMPTSFDDSNSTDNPLANSGIAYTTVRVTPGSSDAGYVITENNIVNFDAARMRLADNTLTILPATDGEIFPATVTFTGLPATNSSGVQVLYRLDVNAADRSGRTLASQPGLALFRDNLRFDTLSPTIDGMTRLNVSARLGLGTEADPYRVGSSRELRTRFLVTERTNNSNNLPSLPITAASVETFDRQGLPLENGVSISTPPSCANVDAQLGCSMVTVFTPAENFDGRVDLRVRDNAGNISDPISFWVRQDSNRPILLPDFTLSANVAENDHFKGTLYRFTAQGIDKNGADKQLTAFVSYTNAANQVVTINADMTETGVNTYTFDAALGSIIQGQQNLSIYFEDSYGNRHQNGESTAEHTLSYGIFHDSIGPDVADFTYTWNEDNVDVQYTGLTDLSFPVRVVVESSEDGITWTSFGDAQVRTDGAGDAFTIANVPVASSVRVRFEDSVKDYAQGNTVAASFTPNTFYIQRDMVLSVEENGESLRVGYVPETTLNLGRVSSYEVSYTGPHGRTGSFSSPTSFDAAGGELGSIDLPLMGTYTFTTTLKYNDGTQDLVAVRTYEQTTDIINPRATLRIAEVENEIRYDADLETYYVRSNNPELALNYTVAPEYTSGATTIYDDSLPLTLRVEGADIPASMSINPDQSPTGAIQVELLEDRIYTLQGVFTDGAGRSVSQTFRVVKDRAEPQIQTRFVSIADGTQLSVVSRASTDPAGTRVSPASDVYLDVLVLNEEEPVTLAVQNNETALGAGEAVPGLLAGQQGVRYRLSNLTEGTLNTYNITATDRAGFTRNASASVRYDASAPALIAGSVEFSSDALANNPAAMTAQFEDYTPVYYRTTIGGVQSERQAYNGNIALPEGSITDLSLVFEDEFGTQTESYPFANPIYVDSIVPTASLTLSPSVSANTPEVSVMATNIVDASPFMDWTASIGGNIVASGRVIDTQYEGPTTLGTVPLQLNTNNVITLQLRDSLGNPSAPILLSILQDDQAPQVTFTDEAILSDPVYDWSFTVTDGLGVGIENVSATMLDVSNGFTNSVGLTTTIDTGTYTSVWNSTSTVPGHSYALAVTTRDGLGNERTYRSTSIAFPRTALDENNPNLDPITIPESITGDILKVTVDNGSTIRYIAENLPRGTDLYLADVLANGENTLATGDMPRVLSKFPVGFYTITIEDNEGNLEEINEYLVSPYYLDAGADINGDGFGGGISDHKLVRSAEEQGNIYGTDALVVARLGGIKGIIETNIANQIAVFLQR